LQIKASKIRVTSTSYIQHTFYGEKSGEAVSPETSGEETSGEETSGEETSGEETSGEETSGEETSGEETSGEEAAKETFLQSRHRPHQPTGLVPHRQ
jgi:hypothetical protein